MGDTLKVSVIIPVYNEEKYIEECIASLLMQDYPREKMEWIFVDGDSTDNTAALIRKYQKKYPDLIRLFDNPKRKIPHGVNKGICNSSGDYIIRLDAHAEYNKDYISKCVYYLENMDADNVGGFADTKARTVSGKTIAKMLSTKFGVGNSRFRTTTHSGYVDTVPFGAFRREVFEKLGGFDERLDRNEDNEMNYRIRKNGGKVYLAEDIKFTYYCRESLKEICLMAFQNGKWTVMASGYAPGSMRIRHFTPFLFLLSLIIFSVGSFFSPLFLAALAAEIVLYICIDMFFSLKISDGISEFIKLMGLYFCFHISYGAGSLAGLFSLAGKKKSGLKKMTGTIEDEDE